MPYELNEKRAMTKKIEATSRECDVKIEHKRGALVMTPSPLLGLLRL
jgi:hypothetical protein